jgi:hypothetical protein
MTAWRRQHVGADAWRQLLHQIGRRLHLPKRDAGDKLSEATDSVMLKVAD